MLKNGMTLKKGWLRDVIVGEEVNQKTHLSVKENLVLTTVASLFSGYGLRDVEMKDHTSMTQHAFGIARSIHSNIIKRFISTGFTLQRKIRSDEGRSVFNSHNVRLNTFTPFNTYKKHRYRDFRESSATIPHYLLMGEWQSLSETEKVPFKIIASRDLARSTHLWDELKTLLLRSKGKISYRTMENQLGGLVCANTIAAWLKRQDGFTVRKDRVLPSLDSQAKLLRVVWAHSFWLFWASARCVKPETAIFVLVHMDEKWFYAVKSRTNCKVLTSIGLEPSDYRAHHKSHVGKEMYIVVTAYILRDQNDITRGGTAVPISCVRVGKMVRAKKNSYKRVYAPDGSYSYPKIDSNLLRKKGEMYLKNCELTGSSEGTEQHPKVSLLSVYKEQIIPDLEEKIVNRLSMGGTRKVIIVKQEDGAGLHQDGTYLREMKRIFKEKDWILFQQPSQSPVTNVHDACIFPMMSKAVSTEQALQFGAVLLKGEDLNKTVMSVWNNERNHVAMSRAFAGHHQLVLSIMKHNGDNEYLTEKGGLSFGVRRTFVADQTGCGVVPVTLAATDESETTQGVFLSERAFQGLKYALPDLNDLDKARLHGEMIRILSNTMDKELMCEDLRLLWEEIMMNAETETDDELVDAELYHDDSSSVGSGEDTEMGSGSDSSSVVEEVEIL